MAEDSRKQTDHEDGTPIAMLPPPGVDAYEWTMERLKEVMAATAAAAAVNEVASLRKFPEPILLLAALTPYLTEQIALLAVDEAPPGILADLQSSGFLRTEPDAEEIPVAKSPIAESMPEPSSRRFRMPDARRKLVIDTLIGTDGGQRERGRLRMAQAAKSLLTSEAEHLLAQSATSPLSSEAEHPRGPLPPFYHMWSSLAQYLDAPAGMDALHSKLISEAGALYTAYRDHVRNTSALRDSQREEASQEIGAEISRWLDAADWLQPLLTPEERTVLESARIRVGRITDFLAWEESDRRLLKNFLERQEQIEVMEQFLEGPDDFWAIHLLGGGGVGKTMLLRHLAIKMSQVRRSGEKRSRPFVVARVDFDHIHPDYPRLSPGLLLSAFAGELFPQIVGDASLRRQAYEAFGQAEIKLAQLTARLQSSGTKADAFSFSEPELEEAIMRFAEALVTFSTVGLRVLLILDTCEELIKVRDERGAEPTNVRATFRILEDLYKEVRRQLDARHMESTPNPLRVVMAGRFPLADSGAGWHLERPGNLTPRGQLLLHEIRGFRADEAIHYLEQRKVPLKEGRQEAILERCRAEGGSGNPIQWEPDAPGLAEKLARLGAMATTEGGRQTATGDLQPRYLPYELRHFGDWVRLADPTPTAATILDTTSKDYVRHRILARIGKTETDRALLRALPAVALLGRFSKQTLRAIVSERGAVDESDAGEAERMPAEGEQLPAEVDIETPSTASAIQFEALFIRLLQQDWISLQPFIPLAERGSATGMASSGASGSIIIGGSLPESSPSASAPSSPLPGDLTVVEADPGVVRRLEEYFRDSGDAERVERRAAAYLQDATLTQEIEYLDALTFVAALKAMSGRRTDEELAAWWTAVEEKLWNRGDWLATVGGLLLQTEGPGIRSPIRAAIYAGYASALQRQGGTSWNAALAFWRNALASIDTYPERGREALRFRCLAAIVNLGRFAGWNAITQEELRECREAFQKQFRATRQSGPADPSGMSVALAALEGLIEHAEARADIRSWLLLPETARPTLDPLENEPAEHTKFFDFLAETAQNWAIPKSSEQAAGSQRLWANLEANPSQRADLSAFLLVLAFRALQRGSADRSRLESVEKLLRETIRRSLPEADNPTDRSLPAGLTRNWVGPLDPLARVTLEYGRLVAISGSERLVYPLIDATDQYISLDSTADTDQDRVRSMLLRRQLARGEAIPLPANWLSIAWKSIGLDETDKEPKRVACQAHRETPPLFVTLAEIAARTGQIQDAEDLLRRATELARMPERTPKSESGLRLAAAVEARRALLAMHRLLRRWDDPKAETPTRIVAVNDSTSLADLMPLWAKASLAGSRFDVVEPPSEKDDIGLHAEAVFWHEWFRTERDGPSVLPGVPDIKMYPQFAALRKRALEELENLLGSRSNSDPAPPIGIDRLPALLNIALDAVELDLWQGTMVDFRLDPEEVRRFKALLQQPMALIPQLQRPEDAFVFQCRVTALKIARLAPEAISYQALGKRRGADILREEGELLALRLPENARVLLDRAADLYQELGDVLPALLANALAVLCYFAPSQTASATTNTHFLRLRLSRLRRYVNESAVTGIYEGGAGIFPFTATAPTAADRLEDLLLASGSGGASSLKALLRTLPQMTAPAASRGIRAMALLHTGLKPDDPGPREAIATLDSWASAKYGPNEVPELHRGQPFLGSARPDALSILRQALKPLDPLIGKLVREVILVSVVALCTNIFFGPAYDFLQRLWGSVVSGNRGLLGLNAVSLAILFGWRRLGIPGKVLGGAVLLIYFLVLLIAAAFMRHSWSATFTLDLLETFALYGTGYITLLPLSAIRALTRRWIGWAQPTVLLRGSGNSTEPASLILFGGSDLSTGPVLPTGSTGASTRRKGLRYPMEELSENLARLALPVAPSANAVEDRASPGAKAPGRWSISTVLQSLRRLALGQRLSLELSPDDNNHAPAWEPALAATSGVHLDTSPKHMDCHHGRFPFHIRRRLLVERATPRPPRPRMSEARALIAVWSISEEAGKDARTAWENGLRASTHYLDRWFGRSAFRIEVQPRLPILRGLDGSIISGEAEDPPDILHLIGRVEESNNGLFFRFASGGTTTGGVTVSVEELMRIVPRLSVCVLQAEPLDDGGPPGGTTSERLDAGRARTFAAQLRLRGVAVVVTLPPMGAYPAGVPALKIIARALTLRRHNGIREIEEAVGRAREIVAGSALPSPRLQTGDLLSRPTDSRDELRLEAVLTGKPGDTREYLRLSVGGTVPNVLASLNKFIEGEALLSPRMARRANAITITEYRHLSPPLFPNPESQSVYRAWVRHLNRRILDRTLSSSLTESVPAITPLDDSLMAAAAQRRAWDICLYAPDRWDGRLGRLSRFSRKKPTPEVTTKNL